MPESIITPDEPVPAGWNPMNDKQVARVQAAYGVECPYCAAERGEACSAMNRPGDYCKVPHVHRVHLAEMRAKAKAR